MKVSEIIEKCKLVPLNDEKTDIEYQEFYISDLMGWALGHAKEKAVLLTIQKSINVVAVSVQKQMAAVVFCEGVIPDQEVIDSATKNHLLLLTTSLNSFEVIRQVYLG